ncbi:unnamed protein product [Larinioides sclopetarius]
MDAFGNDIFEELLEYFAEVIPGFLQMAKKGNNLGTDDLSDDLMSLLNSYFLHTRKRPHKLRHAKEF